MAFSLTFETDNAAFDDGSEGADACADILRNVSAKLLRGDLAGPVRVANGNTIGGYTLGEAQGVSVVLTRDELEVIRTALTDRETAIQRATMSPADDVAREAIAAVILTRQKINAALAAS